MFDAAVRVARSLKRHTPWRRAAIGATVVALGIPAFAAGATGALAAAGISVSPQQGAAGTTATVTELGQFNCKVPGTLYLYFGPSGFGTPQGSGRVYLGTLQDQVGATFSFQVASQGSTGAYAVYADCRGIAQEGPQVNVPFQLLAAAATTTQPAQGRPSLLVVKDLTGGAPSVLTTASPGESFAVTGSGFPCSVVRVQFDGVQLGLVTLPPPGGSPFQQGGFKIPQNVAGGTHQVTGFCSVTGAPIVASFPITITGGPATSQAFTRPVTVPGPVPGSSTKLMQPQIAQALRSPAQVSLNPLDVLKSALLAAALMCLIAFPSELFNSTLQEHYDEVKSWFGFASGPGIFSSIAGLMRHRAAAITAVVLGGALLYGFLDPAFGFNLESLATFVGLAGAIAIATLSYAFASGYFIRLKHGKTGSIKVFPGALVVALVCVVISRATNFLPGYLYGVMAAFRLTDGELEKEHQGRASAVAAIWMLGISVLAWVLWVPVKTAAQVPDPGLVIVALSALLAGTFVAGIEGILFGMVPLRFLEGERVFAWSRVRWAVVTGVAALLFVHVLLNPAVGYVSGTTNLVTAGALFLGFGALSVGFWAYFRFRPAGVTEATT